MDLNSDAWRDLIFEGKNKRYGAYYLRRTSSRRHLRALLIVIGITVVVSIALLVFIHFGWSTKEFDLKPVNISNLIVMTEYHFDNPETPEEETLIQKQTNTTLQIAEDNTISELPDETVNTEFLSDSTETVPPDSVFFEKSNLNDSSESINEDIALDQELTQTDSISEIQAFELAMKRFIYENLKYPNVAYKQKKQGSVIFSFILNQDGSISDIELIKGVYIFLDEEALRVIRSMPIWKPIKKDGKAIRIKCYIPINFSL